MRMTKTAKAKNQGNNRYTKKTTRRPKRTSSHGQGSQISQGRSNSNSGETAS